MLGLPASVKAPALAATGGRATYSILSESETKKWTNVQPQPSPSKCRLKALEILFMLFDFKFEALLSSDVMMTDSQ